MIQSSKGLLFIFPLFLFSIYSFIFSFSAVISNDLKRDYKTCSSAYVVFHFTFYVLLFCSNTVPNVCPIATRREQNEERIQRDNGKKSDYDEISALTCVLVCVCACACARACVCVCVCVCVFVCMFL